MKRNRKQKLVAGFIAPLVILAIALFVVDTSPGGEGHSGRAASATYATSRLPVSVRILGMGRVGEVLVGALKGPKPRVPRTLGFQWQACDWREAPASTSTSHIVSVIAYVL